ncbi:major facilitator superfamily multidrug resistance protein [Rhodococcus gordoniae]|uniref:Major facilitator superfamily multidrug resistance protein n=1 Tax=Rhodococcus gordoniae TaxID=223392 RepID=A0A379M3M8_9NOCA|nr:MFS transporter [Rhodococcus gordoniae]SUE16907.1 major facilitator superfamily multidrug resistance protein [Rhodococcus gordoniae]
MPLPPRHWLLYLCLSTALLHAAFQSIRVLVSYRILALGGDAATIGAVTALYALVPLVAAVLMGRAVDRGHATAVLRSGIVVTTVGAGSIALSSGLIVLALGNIVLGLGQLLVTVSGQAFVSILSPPGELDRGFAGITLGVSVGQAVGVPVAGAIAATSGDGSGSVETTGALLVMTVVSLLALPLVLGLREPPGSGRTAEDGAPQSILSMLATKGMKPAMLSSLVVLASVDLVVAYLPLLGEQFGFGVLLVTILLTARTVASILARALLPWALRHIPRTWLLVSATAGTVVPVALIPLVPNPWVIGALLAVCGMFWGVGQPLTMTWVVGLVAPSDRASALAVRLTGNRLGQVAVPLAAGAVAGIAGVASVFWVTAILLSVAATTTWTFARTSTD